MNLVLGRKHLGRYPLAGHWTLAGGVTPTVYSQPYRPGCYTLIFYNADGTKLGRIGSDMGQNPVISCEFELTETGCGAFTLVLGEAPGFTINYGTRLDIHLFDDVQPWYSGFVIEKPLAGSTSPTLKYTGHGYVAQLDWILVDADYSDQDIAGVAKSIVRNEVEPVTGILYRSSKITATGYRASGLSFSQTKASEAIKQLAEFASNYRYGVDAYREFFFKPISTDINEQARFTVGKHLSEFLPKESIDKLCNRILVKSGQISEGDNILATVEDAASQATYGLREEVKTIPSALTATDATRWGQTQIARFKDPIKSASVKGVQLWSVTPTGTYTVRKLTPEGQARITSEDGTVYGDYPISKVKYSISADGIICALTLGDTSERFDEMLVAMNRAIKQNEILQRMANSQLSS